MGLSVLENGDISKQGTKNRRRSPSPSGLTICTDKLDAGLRSLDHCMTFYLMYCIVAKGIVDKHKLPQWRYLPRQRLLPVVRWETPYLAALQSRMRSPALDSYFSITANLGTHTFFMIFLPILELLLELVCWLDTINFRCSSSERLTEAEEVKSLRIFWSTLS